MFLSRENRHSEETDKGVVGELVVEVVMGVEVYSICKQDCHTVLAVVHREAERKVVELAAYKMGLGSFAGI